MVEHHLPGFFFNFGRDFPIKSCDMLRVRRDCHTVSVVKEHDKYIIYIYISTIFFGKPPVNLGVLPFGDICRPGRSKSEPDVQKLQLKVGNLFGRSRSACRSIMTSTFYKVNTGLMYFIASIDMSCIMTSFIARFIMSNICHSICQNVRISIWVHLLLVKDWVVFQQKKMKGCLEKSMHIINIDVRNLKHHVLLEIETSIWLM